MQRNSNVPARRANKGLRPGSHTYKKFHNATDLDLTKGFHIYTDGSTYNNGKKNPDLPEFGAWGMAIFIDGDEIGAGYGGWEDATISVAELEGVTRAVQYVTDYPAREVVIISDSQYVIKGITEWAHNWKRKARGGVWYNSEGEVKNQEMWKKLVDMCDNCPTKLTFAWIKGHSNNPYNDRADELANIGRDEAVAAGSGSGVIIERYFDNLPDNVAPSGKKPDNDLLQGQKLVKDLNEFIASHGERFEIGLSDDETEYVLVDNNTES